MIRKLFKAILGLDENWKVNEVIVDDVRQEVTVHVSGNGGVGSYKCPKCQKEARYHDTQEKQVKYFDTCDYKTWIEIKYARVICHLCGMADIEPEFIKKVKPQ